MIATVDSELDTALNSLRLRQADGYVHLDQNTRLHLVACTAVRGLMGHFLHSHAPDLFSQFFKPGEAGNRLPAFILQPRSRPAARNGVSSVFPFRLITVVADVSLLSGIQNALVSSSGSRFGQRGVTVHHVEWDDIRPISFQAHRFEPSIPLSVRFTTPLQIRSGGRTIGANELSLGHLVRSLVRRINILSTQYGNGTQLDEQVYLSDAAMAVRISDSLSQQTWSRSSSTQPNRVYVGGIVGSIVYRNLSMRLQDLLSLARHIHIGRHTVEGCGMIRLSASSGRAKG